jgi:hypothetical protein
MTFMKKELKCYGHPPSLSIFERHQLIALFYHLSHILLRILRLETTPQNAITVEE